MRLPEIILIALGLSMDAFAVSITLGLSVKRPKIKEFLIPGVYFGLFQMIMPLAGYFAGTYFAHKIQELDHWVAFALLVLIGGKMIKESFSKEKEKTKGNPFQFSTMLLLAIATSIDALAVGITFAFLDVDIWKSIIIIGVVTLCLSMCGVKIGNVFGTKFKSKAEFIGGAVLVILGVKILIEHLFF
ncbi:MAG: manganese efflux pump MntP family protein [Bacteroidales bacterium]|nr:manganese efflux pump MntP family protein [Bacteroidales bacterium]